jgi:hypothetical protein
VLARIRCPWTGGLGVLRRRDSRRSPQREIGPGLRLETRSAIRRQDPLAPRAPPRTAALRSPVPDRERTNPRRANLVSEMDSLMGSRFVPPSMLSKIDPGVVALFGSETRAATLGALANSGQPLTAYRVAKMTGTQVIKAITELRRLEKAGVVDRAPTVRGRTGWVLSDRSLQDFLRRRVRIVWSADWDREVGRRIARRTYSRRVRVDLSQFVPTPESVPNQAEFTRSPAKDRLLARAGLRTSRRSSPSR